MKDKRNRGIMFRNARMTIKAWNFRKAYLSLLGVKYCKIAIDRL